jgi:hypothetical protein
MGFLINSKIRQWIKKEPTRLATQAQLLQIEHRFLDADSWVDCRNLYPFTDDELVSHRQRIGKRGIAAILEAVSNSTTIISDHKELIQKRIKR